VKPLDILPAAIAELAAAADWYEGRGSGLGARTPGSGRLRWADSLTSSSTRNVKPQCTWLPSLTVVGPPATGGADRGEESVWLTYGRKPGSANIAESDHSTGRNRERRARSDPPRGLAGRECARRVQRLYGWTVRCADRRRSTRPELDEAAPPIERHRTQQVNEVIKRDARVFGMILDAFQQSDCCCLLHARACWSPMRPPGSAAS
jgi:hypothetical protein